MFNIGGFLEKFILLDKNNNQKINIILESIKNNSGVSLNKESIEIKDHFLKINSNSVVRNEIFMHKEKIEKDLKSKKIFLKVL